MSILCSVHFFNFNFNTYFRPPISKLKVTFEDNIVNIILIEIRRCNLHVTLWLYIFKFDNNHLPAMTCARTGCSKEEIVSFKHKVSYLSFCWSITNFSLYKTTGLKHPLNKEYNLQLVLHLAQIHIKFSNLLWIFLIVCTNPFCTDYNLSPQQNICVLVQLSFSQVWTWSKLHGKARAEKESYIISFSWKSTPVQAGRVD